jgi:hypothetical protein
MILRQYFKTSQSWLILFNMMAGPRCFLLNSNLIQLTGIRIRQNEKCVRQNQPPEISEMSKRARLLASLLKM